MSTTPLGLWRMRAMRFGFGAAAIGATTVTGIIRNKWFALHLDTHGIGVIGQVVATHTWIGVAAALGLGVPVARAIGAARGAGDTDAIRRTVWTAWALTAGAAVTAVAAGLVAAPYISTAILGSPDYSGLVRISMIGAAGYAIHLVAQGVFSGHADVRPPFTIALAGGSATVVGAFLLVPAVGLTGGMLSAAAFFPAGLLAALLVHGRAYRGVVQPAPDHRFDPATARSLLVVGVSSLVLALADQGAMLAMRSHFVRVHGLSANGLFQAALALSQQVGAVFYAYLANYAFGTISAAQGEAAVRDYTRRTWFAIVLGAAPVFAVAMVAASPILHLFYSDRFDPARPMMAWMLLGEFCRVCILTWSLGALPLRGTRLWVAVGLVAPIAFAIAYPLLARGGNELALARAYAAAGVAGLVVAGAFMIRAGVSLRRRDLALGVAAVAGLALVARAVAG